MKRISMMAMVVLLVATTGFAQQQEKKIVVVNMIDLVRFHPSRDRDRKLMEETERDLQEKLDKRRERFDQLRDKFEKDAKEARNPALSEKARSDLETQLDRQRSVILEFDRELRMDVQKAQQELAELDTRLLRQVTTEIRDVISKYATSSSCRISRFTPTNSSISTTMSSSACPPLPLRHGHS